VLHCYYYILYYYYTYTITIIIFIHILLLLLYIILSFSSVLFSSLPLLFSLLPYLFIYIPSPNPSPLPQIYSSLSLLFHTNHPIHSILVGTSIRLFIFSDIPLLPLPNIHSILVGTWIGLFIFQTHQQSDPACFIGVDG